MLTEVQLQFTYWYRHFNDTIVDHFYSAPQQVAKYV